MDKVAAKFIDCSDENAEICGMMGAYSYDTEKVRFDIIGNLSNIKFESVNICVPEKVDEYLKHIYGSNYLTPLNRGIDSSDYFAYISNNFQV